MKILIAIGGLSKGIGGIERLGAWLANSLAGKGHEICVAIKGKEGAATTFDLKPGIERLYYVKDDSQENVAKIRKEIQRLNPDACLTRFSTGSHMLWMAALSGTGIPHVLSEHNDPATIEARRWPRHLRLASMSGADIIHMLLQPFKSSLPEDFRDRVRIIPNPSIVPSTKPGDTLGRDTNGKRILLSLGRLHADHKQIGLLVEAFAKIHTAFPDWVLHIWGEGPDKPNIEKLVVKLGLESCVKLCGLTREAQVQYRSSQLFCIPSRYEGFGMTVVEAMSHKIPVIGFASCPGVNSLVKDGENGLLAPEMTANSLSEALRKLMADDQLRAKLGENAYEFSKDFSPDRLVPKWEAVLSEAAASKGKTRLQSIAKIPESTRYQLELERILQNEHVFRSPTQELQAIKASDLWRLLNFPSKIHSLYKRMTR